MRTPGRIVRSSNVRVSAGRVDIDALAPVLPISAVSLPPRRPAWVKRAYAVSVLE
jgi:hypothetical protein